MSRVALRMPLARREFSQQSFSSFHPSLKSVQKAAAACLAGLGLASVCFWGLDPSVAAELARNTDSPLDFILHQASPRAESAMRPVAVTAGASSETPVKRKARASIRLVSTSIVCVRLCDGYFFPAENAAACGALCPGAAMEAFFQPFGADGIDNAISAAGRRYTALPTAYRYRTAFDETCSCRGSDGANASLLALNDPSLRRGDAVMTEDGVKVFRGGALKGANAFSNLAKAAMPLERRSILLAMEKVSAPGAAAQRARLVSDHGPVAARAPRHMRTASLRWPRPVGGIRAFSAQRSSFRGYDLDEAYW